MEKETFMENAIEVRDLRKTFRVPGRGGATTIEAVAGISLSVRPGEIYGFLGPNGAGKTTSQRMMTTLLPIGGGEVRICGCDVGRQPHAVRRRIGYVSQLGGADLNATGRENLLLAAKLYGLRGRDAARAAEEASDLLDIGELLGRVARTYSGGQKRRLEIALGILHRPEVLFLDEPTTGLDPQNRANLWRHIRELRGGGMTVFLTTHYLEEADELADRVAIIDRGKIVAEGTPEELKRRISGDVIALRAQKTAPAQQLRQALGQLAFVRESRAEGDTVYLYVESGASALPPLFEALAARRIEPETVTLARPTLDDVFLQQTGRMLRDTGKEGASA